MTGTVEDAYQVLMEVQSVMQELDVPFILDGGTLLGFIRDKTFCKDDHTDIDITVWDSEHNENWFVGIIPTLKEKLYKLEYILHNHWDWNNKAHELSVIKEGIKVDIFFKERKGKWSWHCLYAGQRPNKWKRNLASAFDHTCQYFVDQDLVFNVPINYDSYLSELYGANWMIPKHKSEWNCYENGTAFTTKEWVEE